MLKLKTKIWFELLIYILNYSAYNLILIQYVLIILPYIIRVNWTIRLRTTIISSNNIITIIDDDNNNNYNNNITATPNIYKGVLISPKDAGKRSDEWANFLVWSGDKTLALCIQCKLNIVVLYNI